MLQHLDPVPFTVENEAHMGLSETQGLLSCDGRNLLIEYRTTDTLFGALKSSLKTLVVPFDEIRSIQCERKLFGMMLRLVICTRTQQALEALPNAKGGRVIVTLERRDWKTGEEFCLAIQEVVVRRRSLRMGEDLDAIEGM